MRVLLVEDDALIAGNLCSIVQDEGHEVAGLAFERDAAVALLETVKLDLVLLDLHLSDGLTGFQVAAAASRAGVPFVFVSANLRVLFFGMAGAAGVIAKPYDDETIAKALRFLDRVLGGEAAAPPPRGLILSLEWIDRLGLKGFGDPALGDAGAGWSSPVGLA